MKIQLNKANTFNKKIRHELKPEVTKELSEIKRKHGLSNIKAYIHIEYMLQKYIFFTFLIIFVQMKVTYVGFSQTVKYYGYLILSLRKICI